jgi:hypothetical protein
VDTVALTKSFGWDGHEVFQQQDVQELCRVLFDALEESFKGTDMEDVIDELYAGELVDYVKCIDVDYSSERRDKFLDYSLAIRPFGSEVSMKSLTECIEHYLEPEILDGDNQYFAESVGRKVDAIKGLKFSKLPQVMSVQLKRFVYDFSGENIVQKKINDTVKFPMVLDMNKYVSTRRKRSLSFVSECSDGGDGGGLHSSGEAGGEELDEFEQFLKRRITELRSGKKSKTVHDAAGCDTDEDSDSDSKEQKVSFSVKDRARGGGSPASMENEADTEAEVDLFNTGPVVYNDFYSVPDLVDYCDNVHPDQKRTVATGSTTPRSSPTGISGGDTKDLAEEEDEEEEDAQVLLKKRGEWIYELYAVLVHSGAIAGGHYYVYIKDLDTNKWWNFNDSFVDEITEKQVREACGGGMQTHTSYYGTKTTVQSCANAYMLMYRKVLPRDADASPFSPAEGSEAMTGDSIPPTTNLFPSDDMVPQYIRDEVTAAVEAAAARRKEEEERMNKLALKIHWKGKVYVVNTMRGRTYKDLLQQIWEELEIAKGGPAAATTAASSEKGDDESKEGTDEARPLPPPGLIPEPVAIEEDGAGDFSDLEDPSQVPISRMRLRVFNAYHKFAQEPFPPDTKGHLSLEAVRITTYRELVVELKTEESEWETYEADGFNIQMNQYDPEKDDFKPAVSMRLPRTATLGDLRKRLAKHCSFGFENIRFLKLTLWSYAEVKSEVLTGDHLKLMSEFRLYDGQKLYWEQRKEGEDPNTFLASSSPSVKAFTAQANRINVLVSLPGQEACDNTVVVDRRWNMKQFREKLASQFNMESDAFRVFRKSSVESELNGDSLQSLFSLGVYNGVCLSLSEGRPLLPGHYLFKIFLYKATNKVGFVDLRIPPNEDEEANGTSDAQSDSPTPTTAQSVEGALEVIPLADAHVCDSDTTADSNTVDVGAVDVSLDGVSPVVATVAAEASPSPSDSADSKRPEGIELVLEESSENDITGFGYKMVSLVAMQSDE